MSKKHIIFFLFFSSRSTLPGPPTRSESFHFPSRRSAATGKGVVSLHGGVPCVRARGGGHAIASSLNSAQLWPTEAVIYNLSALRPACAPSVRGAQVDVRVTACVPAPSGWGGGAPKAMPAAANEKEPNPGLTSSHGNGKNGKSW